MKNPTGYFENGVAVVYEADTPGPRMKPHYIKRWGCVALAIATHGRTNGVDGYFERRWVLTLMFRTRRPGTLLWRTRRTWELPLSEWAHR